MNSITLHTEVRPGNVCPQESRASKGNMPTTSPRETRRKVETAPALEVETEKQEDNQTGNDAIDSGTSSIGKSETDPVELNKNCENGGDAPCIVSSDLVVSSSSCSTFLPSASCGNVESKSATSVRPVDESESEAQLTYFSAGSSERNPNSSLPPKDGSNEVHVLSHENLVPPSKPFLSVTAAGALAVDTVRALPKFEHRQKDVDDQLAAECKFEVDATSNKCLSSAAERLASEKKPPIHCDKMPRSNSLPSAAPEKNLMLDKTPSRVPSPIGMKSPNKPSATLRRGKWTTEEEAYVAQIIHDFNAGYLNAPAGTTLRSYLSEKLQCDPMRITKKFTGEACIGKRVFHPAIRSASNASVVDKAQAELDLLERKWRKRLEIQQKESAKKAAAATASASHHLSSGVLFTSPHPGVASSLYQLRDNAVATMAKWLDRASVVLANDSGTSDHNSQLESATQSLPMNSVEFQLKEVEELIVQGPKIQQTSAGLPKLLEDSPAKSSVGDSTKPSVVTNDAAGTKSECASTSPEISTSNKRKFSSDGDVLVTAKSTIFSHINHQQQGCIQIVGEQLVKDGAEEPPTRKHCLSPEKHVLEGCPSLVTSSVADAKGAEALVGFLNSVRYQNKTFTEKPPSRYVSK